MEYYPQESLLLDIARERAGDPEFIGRFTAGPHPLTKACYRQVKTVLKECQHDTDMFLQFSSLLEAYEKKWQSRPTEAERQAEYDKSYRPISDYIVALMAVDGSVSPYDL